MSLDDLTPEPEEKASNEGSELNDEQLNEIAGGAQAYEDPREKDHSNKKDDPKDW